MESDVAKRRGRQVIPISISKEKPKVLGTTVRTWREYRSMSQTDLALAADLGGPISRGYVSKLEHGQIKNPGRNLDSIARALGTTRIDLMNGSIPEDAPTIETIGEITPEPYQPPLVRLTNQLELLNQNITRLIEVIESRF